MKPTYYRNCVMPARAHHGLYTAYVKLTHDDGTFVHASSLPGLRHTITHTLAAHGLKSAHR